MEDRLHPFPHHGSQNAAWNFQRLSCIIPSCFQLPQAQWKALVSYMDVPPMFPAEKWEAVNNILSVCLQAKGLNGWPHICSGWSRWIWQPFLLQPEWMRWFHPTCGGGSAGESLFEAWGCVRAKGNSISPRDWWQQPGAELCLIKLRMRRLSAEQSPGTRWRESPSGTWGWWQSLNATPQLGGSWLFLFTVWMWRSWALCGFFVICKCIP